MPRFSASAGVVSKGVEVTFGLVDLLYVFLIKTSVHVDDIPVVQLVFALFVCRCFGCLHVYDIPSLKCSRHARIL